MPMMKNVLGLDLGSHSVKAVELRQTFSGVEPAQMRVHARAESDDSPGETLRRFVEAHQLPLEHVTCALPGDRISSRRLEFPFRDKKRLTAAVPFEVESEIPFALEDVLIDWAVVGGDRSHGSVWATIAPRREVAGLLAELGEWGCDPRILEAEGMVLGNLASLFDLPGNRLLIDLGHRKTTLCLLLDGVPIAARSLPMAGAALTQAIAKDRDWSLEQAETSKCEEGIFHLGFESASPGAVAVLDRISREIVRTLESLESVLGGTPETQVAGITLMGGSARLHRLDEYLSERTGIPTGRLSIPAEGDGAAILAGGDPLIFGPALALALRSTAETRVRMNFRREEFAYRTDLSQYFGGDLRWTAVIGLALLVLLGGRVLAGISVESHRASLVEKQIAALYEQSFPDQAVPSQPVAAMRNAVASARDRADFLGIYGTGSALDLLAELSRRVPPDLEVKFEEVNIDRQVVRIKVFATSFEAADRLERLLAEKAPFQSAKAGEITTDSKRKGQTFTLTISLASAEEEER